MWAISWTARSKASWLAADGLAEPLTLRTNWMAAAVTSDDVAGGSKLFSGRMLRHMGRAYVVLPRTSPVRARSQQQRCLCHPLDGLRHGRHRPTMVEN